MIHHLADNGTMAVILPHGALFRGGAEGHIREYLIKDRNYLDAVIGLPANIFYGTSIPTCILVFKKCREHGDDILFIDASSGFEKSKNQNTLRDCDVEKIVTTYRQRNEEARYSHRATLAEIVVNEFNLNISRYVDTFEDEQAIDLDTTAKELKTLESSMIGIDDQIRSFCKELGIGAPV
jgi:type I restriction enzyme M protein